MLYKIIASHLLKLRERRYVEAALRLLPAEKARSSTQCSGSRVSESGNYFFYESYCKNIKLLILKSTWSPCIHMSTSLENDCDLYIRTSSYGKQRLPHWHASTGFRAHIVAAQHKAQAIRSFVTPPYSTA
jgi:hypothetical protein